MKGDRSLSRISVIKKFIKKRRELKGAVSVYRKVRDFLWYLRNYPDLLYEGQRVKKFKDCHIDRKRCFLVGNGPSIRYQNLTKLKDEVVFVTNSFVLHTHYEEISPTYYCISDPRAFVGDINHGGGKLMKQKAQAAVKFFPLFAKKAIQKSGLFHEDSVYYLNFTPKPIWKTGRMSLDVSKEVYTANSVIIDFCLPLAFYMGFSEVYLVGCDTDYALDRAEDLSQGYFYDVNLTTTPHAPLEFLKGKWYNRVIASYKVAREAFEQEGRKIYNATLGGKLEVFERVDFEEVLGAKHSMADRRLI